MQEITGVWLRTGVIAVITLLAAVAAPPARGAKADLAVTKVAGAPTAGLTGEAPALKVTVKNVGRKDSGKASLFAQVLGEDGGVVDAKFGKGSVPPLDAGRKRKVTFRPKVPYEAVGEWLLGVCVAPGKAKNDCGQTGVIEFSDGSTIGRIDAALADGDIDEGEALLYKLYAVSGDDGLPDEYDGGGPLPTGVILGELVSAYATLPDTDQAAVEPFMLQPRYAESAWAPGWAGKAAATPRRRGAGNPCRSTTALSGAWSGIQSTHAVFWHRPQNAAAQAKAQALSAEFESEVWPELTGAFIEVNDAAAAPCDPAGDSRIDIYIDSGSALLVGRDGVAPALAFNTCGPNPSFVVLPQNADRWALAHEFMHVIQHAYTACERAPAWVEGTATWAGHYVYEDDNYEHRYAGNITIPFIGLRARDYDAWPFWYSLENNDDVDAIVRVFEALAGAGFADALEQGPSDGLEEAWKRYAVERWNQVPIGAPGFPLMQSFKQADGFTEKPGGVPLENVILGGMPERLFDLKTSNQEPLSTWFHRVKINDETVRELEFRNADDGIQGTVVQAFLKLQNGNWKLEDWSDQGEVKLCRDQADENVVEMVVATSNRLATGGPLGVADHTLRARDSCTQAPIQGTIGGTESYTSDGGDVTMSYSFTGTVTFERNGSIDPRAEFGGTYPDAVWARYEVTGGTITYSGNGTSFGCTVELPSQTAPLSDIGVLALEPGPEPRYGIRDVSTQNFAEATFRCPPGNEPFPGTFVPPAGVYTPDPRQTMQRGTYVGTSTVTDQNVNASYSWNLSEVNPGP